MVMLFEEMLTALATTLRWHCRIIREPLKWILITKYAYRLRGYAFYALEQWSEALTDYSVFLDYNPNHIPTILDRGDVYRRLGNYYQAIDDYSRVIELGTDEPLVYLVRTVSYDNIRDYDAAFDDFDTFLDLVPGDTPNTRFACEQQNALQWYVADNLLELFFGRPCSRFPFEYASQAEFESATSNCQTL